MRKFLEGGLAIIYREDAGLEANIGSIVRTMDRDLCEEDEWRCVCEYKPLLAFDLCTGVVDFVKPGEEFWIREGYLKPLNGEEGNESWFTAAPKTEKVTS